jgi:methyltransferase (TIGR00027 family)
MKPGEPSRTAFGAARHRALHQTVDGASVFRDPLAWRILGLEPPTDPLEISVLSQERRGLRLFIAARHRIAEDVVQAAYTRGARQVIVLGAGFDTFAYRNPHRDLVVYEVDFPATGVWKQERLADAGIDTAGVRYVGVDFEHDDLRSRLLDAGFDPTRPSAVMWLGVVPYLTPEAVAATLNVLGGFTQTSVVFDYPQPEGRALDGESRRERAALRKRVAAIGEPLLSSFTPETIGAVLREAGFTSRQDRAIGPEGRAHVMVAGT